MACQEEEWPTQKGVLQARYALGCAVIQAVAELLLIGACRTYLRSRCGAGPAYMAIAIPGTLSALNNTGAHGFAEVLYAYASTADDNGSAFAGLTVASDFFQITTGSAMLFGRFIPILAVLALASTLARQKRVEAGAGTLPTDGALFGVLVGGTLMLIAALTFFPALALGPIAEALS
jgi:K+-transporting ATPase ATPase A chain